MIDKKKAILRYLEKNGRSPTSQIASYIRSDLWLTKRYLEELESEKKIEKEEETNRTYWVLK